MKPIIISLADKGYIFCEHYNNTSSETKKKLILT